MATIFYTASSLDGFLAAADDDISWLDALPQPSKDTYTPFMANVGAVCMGSATYRFLLNHVAKGNSWPHKQPTWVFTTKKRDIPKGAAVHIVQGDVRPVHAAMTKVAKGKDVWVCGGGELAAKFLDAGLLDELVVTVAAQTLGAGKPLLPRRAKLKLKSVQQLGEGFVELRLVPA